MSIQIAVYLTLKCSTISVLFSYVNLKGNFVIYFNLIKWLFYLHSNIIYANNGVNYATELICNAFINVINCIPVVMPLLITFYYMSFNPEIKLL